jgi:hypothetical protein
MGREQSPVEVHGIDDVLEELKDKSVEELLVEILLELKKLNAGFTMATGIQASDEDII